MQKINSYIELQEAILALESENQEQGRELKELYDRTFERIKPENFVKNTIKEILAFPFTKDNNLLNAAIGLTTGYLSKKVVFGSTHNPLKKIVGAILETAVAAVAAKKGDAIKNAGIRLVKHFFKKKSEFAPGTK